MRMREFTDERLARTAMVPSAAEGVVRAAHGPRAGG